MVKSKIVHIAYSGLGGTNEYINSLILGDTSGKYNHIVIFFGVEKLSEDSYAFIRKISSEVHFVQKNVGVDKTAIRQLKILLKKIDPSTIICHVNSLIIPLGRIKKVNLIFVEHQANHLKKTREWLWSLIAQIKAKYVIAFTDQYQIGLKKKLGWYYRTKKNLVINTGIHLSDFRKESESHNDVLKIGITSRINEYRDHESLLKGFMSLVKTEKAELHIAGDGPLRAELQKKYSSDRIYWHGPLPRNQIVKLLKDLDIYVIASYGESTSIALMQAQSSGLAIIGTKVEGIVHILNDQNSLLVEAGNSNDYHRALETLIENTDLRRKLGEASLSYAEAHLDNKQMFNSFKEIIA